MFIRWQGPECWGTEIKNCVSLRQEAGLSCITHEKNEAPKVQMPGPGQRHRSVLTGSHSVAQAVLEIAV